MGDRMVGEQTNEYNTSKYAADGPDMQMVMRLYLVLYSGGGMVVDRESNKVIRSAPGLIDMWPAFPPSYIYPSFPGPLNK